MVDTLRSPRQAAQTFSQVGGFPRQRNVFIIRFVANPLLANFVTNLTYATKSISRPHVNPKTEEMNQYNKKRQIYTGYKLEPIHLQFFDSADGSAQNMWTIYSRFYFGDLNDQSGSPLKGNPSYAYDIVTANFNDFTNSGFGFTARNNGGDRDAEYFFDRLEIYHFYDGYFDQYNLIHPKISGFEPDDLDYEVSSIAMISMTMVYENLQYFPQQAVTSQPFPEFSSAFDGFPIEVPAPAFPLSSFAGIPSLLPSNPSVQSILSAALSPVSYAIGAVENAFISSASGALSAFGNFIFGPGTTGYIGFNGQSSISGQAWDATNAPFSAASSNAFAPTTSLSQAALGRSAPVNTNAAGQIIMSPTAIGNFNASTNGTSNIGFVTPSSSNPTNTGFTPGQSAPQTNSSNFPSSP